MSTEQFIEKRFTPASIEAIDRANAILAEYEAKGYDLSLRQLFYQMVARGMIENTQRSYKNLGSVVTDARLAGLMDWDMIKDRGRETHFLSHWSSPAEIIRTAAHQYRRDKWESQENHVEVVVEKQALEGVLIPVCEELDIRFTANKGYGSVSLMYEMGKRLAEKAEDGKGIVILYLGDHDPSGMDMTRDVDERLAMFSYTTPEIVRIALNMDQVERWNPPPNSAKMTDSRVDGYLAEFGRQCWELDAINPTDLADLVRNRVLSYRDERIWDEDVQLELDERNKLIDLANQWHNERSGT